MGRVNEIKCPHCGEWTVWDNRIDDKCLKCDGILEPHRFSREAEKKAAAEERKSRKVEYFAVLPGDGSFKREIKGFLNAFGWIVFYSEVAFYACVTVVILLLGVIAG